MFKINLLYCQFLYFQIFQCHLIHSAKNFEPHLSLYDILFRLISNHKKLFHKFICLMFKHIFWWKYYFKIIFSTFLVFIIKYDQLSELHFYIKINWAILYHLWIFFKIKSYLVIRIMEIYFFEKYLRNIIIVSIIKNKFYSIF